MSTGNPLYLVVLPLVHVTATQMLGYGLTEQVLTLMPGRDQATEFFPDEVDSYVLAFKDRANKHLVGGHVIGYDFKKFTLVNGRVIVEVVQRVRP
jgi:hypothetical protein